MEERGFNLSDFDKMSFQDPYSSLLLFIPMLSRLKWRLVHTGIRQRNETSYTRTAVWTIILSLLSHSLQYLTHIYNTKDSGKCNDSNIYQ